MGMDWSKKGDALCQTVVAVVDGDRRHRQELASALDTLYRIRSFAHGDQAIARLSACPPGVLLIDERAGPAGGHDLIRQVRRVASLADVPVILTTTRGDGDGRASGADAVLVKPYRRSALIREISRLLGQSVERGWDSLPPLQRDALKGTKTLFNRIGANVEHGEPITYMTIAKACRPLVEAVGRNEYRDILAGIRHHDDYSYAHCVGTATGLLLFGHAIGLRTADLVLIAAGGLLHDVGKMSIPHEVLNKPGRLTPDEFEVMKGHVKTSIGILENCPDLCRGIVVIAGQHHERLDGSGYPLGLAGTQLNELARMASIVDIFGALTDRRVYRAPMAPEMALKVMTRKMATKIDQHLLSVFKEILLDSDLFHPLR